jgi:hypothetical protein
VPRQQALWIAIGRHRSGARAQGVRAYAAPRHVSRRTLSDRALVPCDGKGTYSHSMVAGGLLEMS